MQQSSTQTAHHCPAPAFPSNGRGHLPAQTLQSFLYPPPISKYQVLDPEQQTLQPARVALDEATRIQAGAAAEAGEAADAAARVQERRREREAGARADARAALAAEVARARREQVAEHARRR